MHTVCQPCACVPLPQHKRHSTIQRCLSVVRRFGATLRAVLRTRPRERQLASLDGLSAETLKDIGAPEWLQAQAYRAHARARQGGLFERESLYWR
ncbi:hypothetical protein [Rhodoferax sp. U11-2br]|uniref:hypothetical protein n=1 Tax=Rhodoferax sp. U11-2br TaxID=2838878 RepID=UPI001BE8955C|nr:hypothetical protein [Rhodoferax sp. U11-2br]MBT3069032.1 hypothetical protein [Rhodoferax sp. U11-2br]